MGSIAAVVGNNNLPTVRLADELDNVANNIQSSLVPGVYGQVLVNPDGSFLLGSGYALPQTALMGAQTFRDAATLPATASQNLFTITGGRVILLNVVATVTTAIQNQANDVQLVATPVSGTAVDLDGGGSSIANLQAGGHISWGGTFANNATVTNAGYATGMVTGGGILCQPGTISYTTSATNTGALKWCVSWLPLDPGAQVIVTGNTGETAWPTATQMAALLQANFGYWTEGPAHTLPQGTTATVFTVMGGDVYLKHIYAEVTTVIQTQTNNFKMTATPITGSAIDLNGTVNITALEVGAHVTNPAAPGNNFVAFHAGAAEFIDPQVLVIPQGTILANCSASSTGALKYGAFWAPKDTGASLVAN